MNCSVEILKTLPVRKGGKTVCFANAGDIYDGTANSSGVVRFYVSDLGGKLYQVIILSSDPQIRVTPFKLNERLNEETLG